MMLNRCFVLLAATMAAAACHAVGQGAKDGDLPAAERRIAVFGGSFSRIKASAAAKDAWAKALGCKVDTYGVNGCGFAAGRAKDNDVSGQIRRALAKGVRYEAFVLWASGNDVRHPLADTSNGVERAVATIRAGAPEAKIVMLNSISSTARASRKRTDANWSGRTTVI